MRLATATGASMLIQDDGGEVLLAHALETGWWLELPLKPARFLCTSQAEPLSLDHRYFTHGDSYFITSVAFVGFVSLRHCLIDSGNSAPLTRQLRK